MTEDVETRLRLALVRVATKPECQTSEALESIHKDLCYHVRMIDDARKASVAETERNRRANLASFNAMQGRANNAEQQRDAARRALGEQIARFNALHAEHESLLNALAIVARMAGSRIDEQSD